MIAPGPGGVGIAAVRDLSVISNVRLMAQAGPGDWRLLSSQTLSIGQPAAQAIPPKRPPIATAIPAIRMRVAVVGAEAERLLTAAPDTAPKRLAWAMDQRSPVGDWPS